jgi:hypothetical protein
MQNGRSAITRPLLVTSPEPFFAEMKSSPLPIAGFANNAQSVLIVLRQICRMLQQ